MQLLACILDRHICFCSSAMQLHLVCSRSLACWLAGLLACLLAGLLACLLARSLACLLACLSSCCGVVAFGFPHACTIVVATHVWLGEGLNVAVCAFCALLASTHADDDACMHHACSSGAASTRCLRVHCMVINAGAVAVRC